MSRKELSFEEKVGVRITELRKSANTLQKDLAAFLKVTVSTVSHYESGINMPQPAILVKIAEFFGVSVDYILGQTDLKMDWKTYRREITLLNGNHVSMESVINKFMSLSEQSQADVCRLIDLFLLDDQINHKSIKKTNQEFDISEASRMMDYWLNDEK